MRVDDSATIPQAAAFLCKFGFQGVGWKLFGVQGSGLVGLVFKAHRRLPHSNLGLRVITKKKKFGQHVAAPLRMCPRTRLSIGVWAGLRVQEKIQIRVYVPQAGCSSAVRKKKLYIYDISI